MNTALNFCFFCFKTKERLKQKATKIIGITSLVDRASSQTIKANKLHCSIKNPVEPNFYLTGYGIIWDISFRVFCWYEKQKQLEFL